MRNEDQSRKLFIEIYNENMANKRLLSELKEERSQKVKELENHTKTSIQFQIGHLFLSLFRRPSLKTLAFPFKLTKLLWVSYRRKKNQTKINLKANTPLNLVKQKQKLTYIMTDMVEKQWVEQLIEIKGFAEKYDIQCIFCCFHTQSLVHIHSLDLELEVVFINGTKFPQMFRSMMDGLLKINGEMITSFQTDIFSIATCFLANYHFGKRFYVSIDETKQYDINNSLNPFSIDLIDPRSSAWEPIVNMYLVEYQNEGLNVPIDKLKVDEVTYTYSETSLKFAQFFSEFYKGIERK